MSYPSPLPDAPRLLKALEVALKALACLSAEAAPPPPLLLLALLLLEPPPPPPPLLLLLLL